MNGPQHYARAEDLLGHARARRDERGVVDQSVKIAEAQVHATLALAAAVGGLDAVEGPAVGSATGRPMGDVRARQRIVEDES